MVKRRSRVTSWVKLESGWVGTGEGRTGWSSHDYTTFYHEGRGTRGWLRTSTTCHRLSSRDRFNVVFRSLGWSLRDVLLVLLRWSPVPKESRGLGNGVSVFESSRKERGIRGRSGRHRKWVRGTKGQKIDNTLHGNRVGFGGRRSRVGGFSTPEVDSCKYRTRTTPCLRDDLDPVMCTLLSRVQDLGTHSPLFRFLFLLLNPF